jgi:hypothetical protein
MYQAQSFDHLRGLAGMSDGQIQEHLELYAGYVKQVNELTKELAEMHTEKKVAGKDFGLAEATRRLSYEYDGMVLHEHYFSNLKPGGARGRPSVSPAAAPSRRRTARSSAGRRTSRPSVACAAWAGSSCSRIPRTAA